MKCVRDKGRQSRTDCISLWVLVGLACWMKGLKAAVCSEFACLCCGATAWTLKHCVSTKDSRKGLFKMTNCEGSHFVYQLSVRKTTKFRQCILISIECLLSIYLDLNFKTLLAVYLRFLWIGFNKTWNLLVHKILFKAHFVPWRFPEVWRNTGSQKARWLSFMTLTCLRCNFRSRI